MQKSEIPAIVHHLLAVEYAGQHLSTLSTKKLSGEEKIAQLFEMYQRAYDTIKKLNLVPQGADKTGLTDQFR